MTDDYYGQLITAVRIIVEQRYGEVDLVRSGTSDIDEETFVFEVLDQDIIVTVSVSIDGTFKIVES